MVAGGLAELEVVVTAVVLGAAVADVKLVVLGGPEVLTELVGLTVG